MAKQRTVRPERKADRRQPINLQQLRRAVKAMDVPVPAQLEQEARLYDELHDLRREVAIRLEPLIINGVDTTKARAILAEYDKKRKQLVARVMSGRGEQTSQEKTNSLQARRYKALDVLATTGLPFTPTSFTLKPFLIWAQNPTNMLLDSHIAPIGHSWAKVHFSREANDASYLIFYYLWTNESDYYAVVNLKCDMIFNGVCSATADTEFLGGGYAGGAGYAWILPLEWWKGQPPTGPVSLAPPQMEPAFGVVARGGSIFSLETGDLDVAWVTDVARQARYELFVIPPGETTVIQGMARFATVIYGDGSVAYDFGSRESYSIASLCQLELLTAPSMM